MTVEKLQLALEYAARGWKVIPLHTPTGDKGKPCSCNRADCSNVGKHPRTMNGLLAATTDEAKIRDWWEMWPKANIGIATGADSGFVVLDVDVKNGGKATLEGLLAQHGKPDEKVYANTGGGGWHWMFAHPGGHWPNTQSGPNKPSRLGAGLDFRGDGGYIVAPGSDHASGRRYEWGVAPNGRLPAMPEWLKALLKQERAQPQVLGDDTPLKAGDRHLTLLAWAGAMRRKGMSGAAILAALRVENANRCNPPKEEAELARIAEFVGVKTPEDPELVSGAFAETTEVHMNSPGLYALDAYEAELDGFRASGLPKGLNPGWNNLAELYTVLVRYLTMVTGSPTAGKSHWMNALMVNMMLSHGWKFATASPEFSPPAYFYSRFMETYTGAPFYHGPTQRMSDQLYGEAKDFLRRHLFFIENRNDEPLTIEFACAMAKRAREEHGAQGLVLDPWAKFAHAMPKGMNETEYIRVTINKLQYFLDRYEMHGWLIVHPKMIFTPSDADGPVITPYALPGSAHWYNLAHNIISLYRRKSDRSSRVEIHVQKVKPHYIGSEGVCEQFFDRVTGRYSEPAAQQAGGKSDDDDTPEF